MRLEIKGLTRAQEMAWLMALPWTFTSEPADDPGEFVVRVAEMPDAIAIGTEKEVVHEAFESLRASLTCRLDFNDQIPLPVAYILPPPVMTFGAAVSDSATEARGEHAPSHPNSLTET